MKFQRTRSVQEYLRGTGAVRKKELLWDFWIISRFQKNYRATCVAARLSRIQATAYAQATSIPNTPAARNRLL